MDNLIEFLRARLDEDEREAQRLDGATWTSHLLEMPRTFNARTRYGGQAEGAVWRKVEPEPGSTAVCGPPYGDPIAYCGESATDDTVPRLEHIARHDPQRVLAEVAAKKRIVYLAEALLKLRWPGYDTFDNNRDAWIEVLKQLAAVYASHPDFQEEWKP